MNKTILITGGTKGIGRAILTTFAREGFHVITCSRSKQDLDQLSADFALQYPNQTISTYIADLSKKEERTRFCASISKLTIDVLVNNTGIFIPGTIHQEEDGVLELMIETNLYSAYDVTRAIVPQMKIQKSGTIFNICSTASITAYENGGSYCISKFAMLGFSKVLREELKNEGIRVTSILPGATYTSSWEGADVPQERFIPAADIGQTVWNAYQLSDRTVIEELVIRPMLGDL